MPDYVDSKYRVTDRPAGSIIVHGLELRGGDQICAAAVSPFRPKDNHPWVWWTPLIVESTAVAPGDRIVINSKQWDGYPDHLKTYGQETWFLVIRP